MGKRAPGFLLPLLVAALACKDDPAPPPAAVEDPATTAATPAEKPEEIPVADAPPSEPLVRLVEPGAGSLAALPPPTPGTPNRIVLEVRITEGKRKVLHLPDVRIAGDIVLDAADESGLRYRITPRQTTVLSTDGVEPEFLATFEGALSPGDSPVTAEISTNAWNIVEELSWPSTENPSAVTIATGVRLALGHLSIPVPPEGIGKGAVWEINRRIDFFGAPAWQTLQCTAAKIEGGQVEIDGTVTYRLVDGEPLPAAVLGVNDVVSLSGAGKLHGRFDVTTATPIDMQLTGKVEIGSGTNTTVKTIGFELRADEDYLAKPDGRVTLTGQVTQGGLVRGVVAPGTTVWFNKKKLKVSKEGDFLFGFGRDAPPRALLSFAIGEEPTERHIVHVTARDFEPEAIDGLPEDMVKLDRETRKALNKSNAVIDKIRDASSDTPYFRDGFRWPARGKITSTYGRKRILNGEDHGYHWGVDIAAKKGGKVRAPAPGVVVFAEKDVPLSGNLVIIDHGHGLTTSYLHLQKIGVKVGDVLKVGQQIGTIGSTGRSTGAHLDWRANLFDTRIDVQTLVAGNP